MAVAVMLLVRRRAPRGGYYDDTQQVWVFADRAETPFAQAALPIGVTTVVVAGLVLVSFFDNPHQDAAGAVRPAAMQRALTRMELERPPGPLPCDARGRPV